MKWSRNDPKSFMIQLRQALAAYLPPLHAYGIAQLGALQLWANSLQNPRTALAAYKHALSLGGSKSLPDLFAAANLKFDFTTITLAPLMALVQKKLAELPE